MKKYYLYIPANRRNGTLYTGVTGNIQQRIVTHKKGINDCFTKKYNVTKLVYLEESNDIRYAILAEKRIKQWKREWKLNLIERLNPEWEDLSEKPVFNLL